MQTAAGNMNNHETHHPRSGNIAHIYCADSGTAIPDSLEHAYLAQMPPRIRTDIARYKRRQDRQATLFGKLLLLRALRDACACPDTAQQKLHSLEVTAYGKPFIPGEPDFNISHSGDMVVLAIAGRGAIGIDVEKIRPIAIDDFLLHVPEVAELRLHNDAERVHQLFFECWTRKEAALKGFGKGLSVPLEQVTLNDGTAHVHGTTWFLKKLPIDDAYCCHVATDQPLEHVAVDRVNLMNGWVGPFQEA